MVREARERVDEWPLEGDSFDALRDGLERTYRHGRRDFRAARAIGPSRRSTMAKRVKELWHHHTLLRELWPPVMEALGNEAHQLANRLGDDHDLAMLAAWVREHAGAEPGSSRPWRRAGPSSRARRWPSVSASTPTSRGAYVRRLHGLWKASQTSVRAP